MYYIFFRFGTIRGQVNMDASALLRDGSGCLSCESDSRPASDGRYGGTFVIIRAKCNHLHGDLVRRFLHLASLPITIAQLRRDFSLSSSRICGISHMTIIPFIRPNRHSCVAKRFLS
jgi:hypothetical protein